MPKVLDKDAIASILESSNEEDDFSDGSNDNYEPSDSEVLSADERSTEDDSEEDAEEALPTTHSTDCAQNTIWSSPNPEFVPRKTLTSYRLPDIISWVISSQLGRRQNPLLDFMIVLAENMIAKGKKRAAVSRSGTSGRKRKLSAGHLPVPIAKRRRCTGCAQQNRERRTKTLCEECQIPLCKDCFAPYHK